MNSKLSITFLTISVLLTISHAKQQPNNGIGIAFSGAGGRLGQHAALMEVLVRGLYPGQKPIRPSYISGVSAGSISAVVLSAILEAEDKQIQGGFTWDDYKELLYGLRSHNIYENSWTALSEMFTENVFQGYLLDNSPLEQLLSTQLQKMNYSVLGDLYIPTCISVVNKTSGQTVRMWSDDPTYKNIPLVDILMASTAIPIAFPPRLIAGLPGKASFIDGGTGLDSIPIFPLLFRYEVQEYYVLCYSTVLISDGDNVSPYLDEIALLKNALDAVDAMRTELNKGVLAMAGNANKPAYLYLPGLNTTFSMLDFDSEAEQFTLTWEWAINNAPSRLYGEPPGADSNDFYQMFKQTNK